MKAYITVVLIALCILGVPLASYAALDWHIRWDENESPQIAKVYIFNPENTDQTFSLEIGDVAKTSILDPNAPYLIIGQDLSLGLSPSERKIFEIIVYQDIDPSGIYTPTSQGKTYQLSPENYQRLGQKYNKPVSSRQYPYTATKIEPAPRDGQSFENQYTYRSGRGYWTIALADHDHILEYLIRTGERIRASHTSIQQTILFYTQGNMQLTDDALAVWDTAFPELREAAATPTPSGDCVIFVSLVSSNQSHYSSSRTVSVGDILASNDPSLTTVVSSQDLSFSVPPNTQGSKQLFRVFPMKKRGRPNTQSEYVSVIDHNSQIERAIRIGYAEHFTSCEIQDVILYLNREVPSLTIGRRLGIRIGIGGGGGTQTPIPNVPTPGRRSVCLGNPFVRSGTNAQVSGMTFKNLIVLLGAVVPFCVLFRRGGRK